VKYVNVKLTVQNSTSNHIHTHITELSNNAEELGINKAVVEANDAGMIEVS